MVDPTRPVVESPEQPPRRFVGPVAFAGALIVTGLVLILTIGIHPEDQVAPAAQPAPTPAVAVRDPRPQPGVAAPRPAIAAPVDRPKVSDQPELDAWAVKVSATTKVPARLLAGYGRAEMWMRSQKPGCHLSWTTLAGIGTVEAERGHFAGAEVAANGDLVKPVVGPALNGGGGVDAVPDTDGGNLDGDSTWDHAIGPMQLLPSVWSHWAERASGDPGKPDPQSVDDSAFIAARDLCGGNDDLATPGGWWKALRVYHPTVEYAQDVFTAADTYAAAGPAS
ncbi:MAG: rane-bound lytic murein transglycosylase [Amycolatopsis sp.]|uniref:murein transglycosylase n=1 Tax=Amycolatopsis sp. TaxID=37632 RepID=UPI0034593E98|nr:rane-bound lytic murein transglycosylase [Amycolatopsis sp.]